MRSTLIQSMMAAAVCLTLAFAGAAPASAQSVMKVCGDQWKAAKAAGTDGWQNLAGVPFSMPRKRCNSNSYRSASPGARADKLCSHVRRREDRKRVRRRIFREQGGDQGKWSEEEGFRRKLSRRRIGGDCSDGPRSGASADHFDLSLAEACSGGAARALDLCARPHRRPQGPCSQCPPLRRRPRLRARARRSSG